MNHAFVVLALSRAVAHLQFRDLDTKSVQLTEASKPVYTYNHGMILAPGILEDRVRCCSSIPAYTTQATIITKLLTSGIRYKA